MTLTTSTFPVVGIGASAGGLEAVSHLLRALPGDPGLAFVVVQHLDPAHDSSLAELLSRVCAMPVRDAKEGLALEPDHVYVMPSNTGMELRQGMLHLIPRLETPEPRRPIDTFLRSLAEDRGNRAIGVILSGTGSDGTFGLEAIRSAGGIAFAQDATAAYGGMPSSAAAAGCVDYVLSPQQIAIELARLSRHFAQGDGPPRADAASPPDPESGDAFDAVVRRLSAVSGVDFSNYKPATLRRRIHRRMAVSRLDNLGDYLALVDRDAAEAEALCRDVLINVTSFFRDNAVFEALKQTVFPALLGRPPERPIRIWVPGCATGEEVYSLAICLLEFLGPRAGVTPIKMFGTDVSESVIARARSGRYSESIEADVGSERLSRFFMPVEDGFQIAKAVRDLCVFARQDATRDPPFSSLDLISCRNVLIYLGPALQKRVLPYFHYALRENGFLLLGTSETVSPMADLFSVVDRRFRIYARRPVASRMIFDAGAGDRGLPPRDPGDPGSLPVAGEVNVLREADRVLLTRWAPPGVLIDESLEILQFRGNTGPFLAPAPGTPSSNLRRMARDGLFPELGEAVAEAKLSRAAIRRNGLRVRTDTGFLDIDAEVIPIHVPLSSRLSFLVLFLEARAARDAAQSAAPAPADETPAGAEQRRADHLERELASTRDYLRAIVEEREAANEELRAANEELLSSNEELQSTNEELQTAHEELQATNEELLTVNDELQHRSEEASRLSDDLTNLFSSVQIPIIMLESDLRIRRFTPSAARLLNLIPSDLDRPILDLRPLVDIPDLKALLLEVLTTFAVKQRDVQDEEGHWHTLWIGPYRSQSGRVDGAVIVLHDVDAIQRAAKQIEQARDFAENIVMTVREPLLVLDRTHRVAMVNDAVRERFRTAPEVLRAPDSGEHREGEWRIPGLVEKLEGLRAGGLAFEDLEAEAEFPELGRRTVRMAARRLPGDIAENSLILLAIEDVTDRRRMEAEAALLAQRIQETQRLESLGVLAGGIAHDFNNILTAILGYANVLQMELPPGSPLITHAENIEQSAFRAADLCRQILAYSGRGRFDVRPLDLSALITELMPLLRAMTSKKAVFRLDLPSPLPSVMGDAAQICQVVMNLVINASESFGDAGGTITVRTGRLRPAASWLTSARLAPETLHDEYVRLEVTDDGCGMDAETLARALDPFFSRKFTGRGLGLSAVLGIVRGHQGALKIDSEPGRGSTFQILFPVVAGPAEEPAPTAAVDVEWRGEGTVLVVDDEDGIRVLLKHMLERLGFHVMEAEDGRAALDIIADAGDRIDVILLDLTMPRLNGAETFIELRKLHPDAKVILMSGYDERLSMEGFIAPGPAGFLHKPFRLREVGAKLREVLEGS